MKDFLGYQSAELDTIVAIATPPGRGGIGIIRLSGTKAPTIAKNLLREIPQPRYAQYAFFYDQAGEPIDQGIALYFPAPRSFTGEDVVEFHAHGGPVVLDRLLQEIVNWGARLAKPGEFSERAFLNNKIDLLQAEAIADLINATSEQAARAAVRSLQGEFSKQIQHLLESLVNLRIHVEAAIDFPEEEIDFLNDSSIKKTLTDSIEKILQIKRAAQQGALLRDGMTFVIMGRPNAGKSSVFNCLCGRDTAIVTDKPGTTRDVLREHIQIDGIPLQLIDTAGLRHSPDHIEKEGIRRAWDEIQKADRLLLVVDSQETPLGSLQQRWPELMQNIPPHAGLSIIRNKIDLTEEIPQITQCDNIPVITLSAKTGAGVNHLSNHLKSCVGYEPQAEGEFIARRRHLDAIDRTHQALLRGQQQLSQFRAGELLAEELKIAQNALGEITGEFTPDDLLGKIFSNFCIGK